MKDAAELRVLAVGGIGGIACCTVDAYLHLTFQDVYLLIKRKGLLGMDYLMEYPRTAKGGATYHHGIHTIALESLTCLFGRGDLPGPAQ